MKKFIIVFLGALVVSCSPHYKAKDFDTSAIYKEANAVLEKHDDSGDLDKEIWPKLFIEIGAKSITVREDGLYIRLSGVFVQESGLYVPNQGVEVNTQKGEDPSYKSLSNNVYSYIVEG